MVGSIRLVPCDPCPPEDDPPVLPPDADYQTLRNNWTIRSEFSQPDLSRTRNYNYAGDWIATVNPVRQTVTASTFNSCIFAYSVDDTVVGRAVWERTGSPSIVSVATGGRYKRPGTNIVLVQNLPYKANEYLFSLTDSEYSYHLRSNTQRVAYIATGVSSERCGPQQTYLVDVPAQGVEIGIPANAPASFTLRWLGVVSTNITGLSLTMAAAGAAQKPWTIRISNGTLTISNNSGISRSFTGSMTTVRNEINAWPTSGGRYFTAGFLTGAFPTTGGLTNVRISDFPNYYREGLSSTTCTTNIPILYAGDVLAPSSTGLGYGTVSQNTKFVDTLGYTDDEAGAKQFLSAVRYRKETAVFETDAGYIEDGQPPYAGPDPTTTALGGSFTPGASVLTEVLSYQGSFGTSLNLLVAETNVLTAICSTDCTPACPPGSFNLGGFGIGNCTGLPGDAGLIPQHQNCNSPNFKCACIIALQEYETVPYIEYLMTQTTNGTSVLS